MRSPTEIAGKLRRLDGLMTSRRIGLALISAVHNFQWITGGGDSHIVLTTPEGVATLAIRDDGKRFVVTNNSEAARLVDEDLSGLGYELRMYRWHEDKVAEGSHATDRRRQIIAELAGGKAIGSDLPYPGGIDIERDLQELRYELTDEEMARYRWVGRRTAEAVAEVSRAIKLGMTEREIEAMTSAALMSRGLTPTVLLIGVDDRLLRYRHATPTDRRLERYAMINVCAKRWGLVVAMTRFVHFGPVPEPLSARLRAVAEVEAAFLAATTPGRTASQVLEAGQQAYRASGYPEEWREHHQGGAIGYREREWVAFPGLMERVHSRQAFAWNPTIQGTKVEDTILALPDRNEVITWIEGWPTVNVSVQGRQYERPGILVR